MHHSPSLARPRSHINLAVPFVVFGPSELATQADNIQRLASSDDFTTFVWSFFTPLKQLDPQPAGWFDFSSSIGAANICAYLVEREGRDVTYALLRGIPGITDYQRSAEFEACVAEKGGWTKAYEHFGDYTREGGYDGTNLILQAYPEVRLIHYANTAMAMGGLEALEGAGRNDEIVNTGWGGTALELDAIRAGTLNATPMRMGDDVGAAAAEAVKFHLEGRADELPLVFLGRILVAHDGMTAEEIGALEQEAFRFSGVGALNR
jgi:autoinducer 2-binding protein LuxP